MTWNTGKPSLANQISADIPDIEENFACLGHYPKLWIPADRFKIRNADTGNINLTTIDIYVPCIDFDGTTTQTASHVIVFPANWDLGTIKAKFYWAPATGASEGDGVAWTIHGRAFANDDALDTALGTTVTITDTVLAGTAGDLHISGATAAITIAGSPAANELVLLEISRDHDHADDDMPEDARFIGLLLQYTIATAIKTSW